MRGVPFDDELLMIFSPDLSCTYLLFVSRKAPCDSQFVALVSSQAHPSMLAGNPRPAKNLARFKRHNSLESFALPERDANRGILVRGCDPVFVLLCGAKELLHLVRSWRCERHVRIEWPCELTEEAVELLLAHGD